MPDHTWQPTELDPVKLNSINGWRASSGQSNIKKPIILDATSPCWSKAMNGFDLIFVVNLLHLISDSECAILIEESIRALNQGGMIAIYGPFRRKNGFASDADQTFHTHLQAQDYTVGYKHSDDIVALFEKSSLVNTTTFQMPANNLMFFGTKV
jgi:hypothetical protein